MNATKNIRPKAEKNERPVWDVHTTEQIICLDLDSILKNFEIQKDDDLRFFNICPNNWLKEVEHELNGWANFVGAEDFGWTTEDLPHCSLCGAAILGHDEGECQNPGCSK